jgi:hypothetical protein
MKAAKQAPELRRSYEEFYISMTPAAIDALHWIMEEVKPVKMKTRGLTAPVVVELTNFKNDLASRLQRLARGE